MKLANLAFLVFSIVAVIGAVAVVAAPAHAMEQCPNGFYPGSQTYWDGGHYWQYTWCHNGEETINHRTVMLW